MRPAAGMQGDALSVVTVERRLAAGKLSFSSPLFSRLRFVARPGSYPPSMSGEISPAGAWPFSGWLGVEAASARTCRRFRRARSIPLASIPESTERDSRCFSASARLFAIAGPLLDMMF